MFKKIRTILIQMAIGGVVGFFAALLIIPFIETFIDTFKTTDFIFIIVFFLLHIETGIMIHESGHLVMGHLTGYRFLSIRWRSFMIQKSPNGKLYFYRFAMKATGGQCLMKPPETDELPIFWYNFGGVFFNLMMILIQFGLLFVFKHRIVLYFLLIGIFVHLFLLVTNWLWMPGISNDGANYRLLKKRKITRYCFKELLNLHALVAEGHRLSEVDLSQHSHHILKEDSIQINFMQNVYQWHRYRFEFDDAKRILDELLNADPQGIIKLLLEADNYVLSLVMDQPAEKNIRVMKVIKMMKAVPSYAMVPVLEELRDNKAPKQETYLNFIKACDSSHLPGEAEDEKRFLEKLIEHKINRSEEA